MKKLSFTFALLLAGPAWSQCATSVNTGGGNCVPPDAPGMPGYNNDSSAPSQRRPVWKDLWGAIVVDSHTSEMGTVIDRKSESQAIRDATQDCAMNGASHCEVVLTYHNQCAAMAWGASNYFVVSNNPTEAGAKDSAVNSCAQKDKACKIVYSACTYARQVN